MTKSTDRVVQHYQSGVIDEEDVLRKISAMVDDMGGSTVTSSNLANLDQFHVGGLAATIELARRAEIRSDMKVLDAGSGLGGPSRYLAEHFGCVVTGIDLSPLYVAISTMLTKRAGLEDNVDYRVGDLARLPFPDAQFNLVWTQHVVMNIADRDGLYGELRRVLKSDGRFVWYDVLAGDDAEAPHYPVPWSHTPENSTLLTLKDTVAKLNRFGFEVTLCDDVTALARTWLPRQQEPLPISGAGIVVGPRMGEMVANFGRNIAEGRVKLVMGVCSAA